MKMFILGFIVGVGATFNTIISLFMIEHKPDCPSKDDWKVFN